MSKVIIHENDDSTHSEYYDDVDFDYGNVVGKKKTSHWGDDETIYPWYNVVASYSGFKRAIKVRGDIEIYY